MKAERITLLPPEEARTEAMERLRDIAAWLCSIDGNRFRPSHDPAEIEDDANRLRERIAGIEPLRVRVLDEQDPHEDSEWLERAQSAASSLDEGNVEP